jgi:hypothetical protein
MSTAFSKLLRNDLITDAADNTSGDITERVMRDFMGSVFAQNVVIIDGNDGDTFPTTLADNTIYKVIGAVVQTEGVTLGQNNVIMADSAATLIVYTGSGPFLTGIDFGNLQGILNLSITATVGSIIALSNSGGNEGDSAVLFDTVVLTADAGDVGSMSLLGVKAIANSFINGSLTVSGGTNVGGMNFNNSRFTSQVVSSDLLNIGTNEYDFIGFDTLGFNGIDDTNVLLTGGPNNVPAGELARVDGCNFRNSTSILSGITTADLQWQFSDNLNLDVSQIIGYAELVNNVTATTINSIGVLEEVDGAWVATFEERTTITTGGAPNGGLITYDALQAGRQIKVDISMSVQKVGGGNNVTYTFWLRHITSGPVTTNFELGSVDLDSGQTARFTSFEQIEFVTGDTIQLFVSNDTNLDDITFSDAKVRFGGL